MPIRLGVDGAKEPGQRAVKRPKKKKVPRPKVEISSHAKNMKEYLKLSWPMGESKKEMEFHQRNLEYVTALYQRLGQVLTVLEQRKGDDWRIVNYLMDVMPGPIEMAGWWAREVNKIANTWEGWQGKLLNWVLTDNTTHLQKKFYHLVQHFCGDGDKWEVIRRALKKEKVHD